MKNDTVTIPLDLAGQLVALLSDVDSMHGRRGIPASVRRDVMPLRADLLSWMMPSPEGRCPNREPGEVNGPRCTRVAGHSDACDTEMGPENGS